jgi:hypothetical protein
MHPYSRRALNLQKFYAQTRNPTAGSAKLDSRIRANKVTAMIYHLRYKPRRIPWRNFSYESPVWGNAPDTLQR